jgi:hypothetical protein
MIMKNEFFLIIVTGGSTILPLPISELLMCTFPHVQVRVCSGKPTTIVASRKGFYPAGKRLLISHALVPLLQQISRVFDAVSLNSIVS